MNTSSSSEDDDPLREARAYNQSIYFMVGMPYLLLGTVGFMVYRGIKAAEKRTKARLLSETVPERDHLLDDRDRPPSDPRMGRE
jgi:hypothetical protein